MKLLYVSSVSATFELDNQEIYYSKEKYDVFLNGEKVLENISTNVFSVFNLNPGTEYKVKIADKEISFKTLSVSEIITSEGIDNTGSSDVTKQLQQLIDRAKDNALIQIKEGTYLITSLKLKSNITLNILKDAVLSASIKEEEYQEIPGEIIIDGKEKQIGTWEGDPKVMKLSILSAFDKENIHIVGEGVVNGNAQLSTWWIDFKAKPYARPHVLYLNNCNNVYVSGVKFTNSPQWTIHPFFCSNVNFFDFKIENPKISPNTDGLNPQCCKGVQIIGVHFSVGDDCIALKSGKFYIGQKYRKPCEDITIRNCLMQFGHGAIVLGSEIGGGIKNIKVERCYFDHTDRGLRIKTRRGRGDASIVDNIEFNNIYMDNVLTPLVMNMFYFCDPDGKTEYVWSKEKLPVDNRTPYLGKFTFNNIKAINSEVCAGYFYGLPEMPIGQINLNNCSFSFKDNATKSTPAMMSFAEECVRRGLIFKNVKEINLNKVTLSNILGEEVEYENNGVKIEGYNINNHE